MKDIYLAGGCFWGVEAYFQMIDGVVDTEVGYANGKTQNPSYEEVCRKDTGFAEAVYIMYDEGIIDLPSLLSRFFRIIDPTSIDRQGPDIGNQYRTGIYYKDDRELPIIQTEIGKLSSQYDDKIQVEVLPLVNYYRAEDYHQDYLKKNPRGYCHVDLSIAKIPL